MSAATIELRDLSHAFEARGSTLPVLDGVELAVPAGAFVSIVGPSGCGKSTVLRVLAGLLRPDRGAADVNGEDVRGRPGEVAYMPQRDLLLPWRKALPNAVLGADIAGIPRRDSLARARELFPAFGLSGFEDAWPAQLSGGMRQRLALLRTFLQPAPVLLLDEPFGALDAITRRQMQRWLEGVWLEDRRTVLLITHDVEEALLLSDTVHVMSARPGKLVRRVDVPFSRPRSTALVTDATFVTLKGDLLMALEESAG